MGVHRDQDIPNQGLRHATKGVSFIPALYGQAQTHIDLVTLESGEEVEDQGLLGERLQEGGVMDVQGLLVVLIHEELMAAPAPRSHLPDDEPSGAAAFRAPGRPAGIHFCRRS